MQTLSPSAILPPTPLPAPGLLVTARPGQDRWLFSIDLLRGIAALAVFLFHAEGMVWRRQGTLDMFQGRAVEFFSSRSALDLGSYLSFGLGFLGVPLFFVISGFCIHLPLAGKAAPLDPRSFAVRRFLRLYPLYLVVVVVVTALLSLKPGNDGLVSWPNFLGHLVFWHFNVPPGAPGMGVSPVLWSIAVEVQFYVLYALLLPVLRRAGFGRSALVFLGTGLVYRLLFAGLDGAHAFPRPLDPSLFAPARFGEWLLGAWIAEAFVRDGLRARWHRLGVGAGALVLALAIGGVVWTAVDRSWVEVPCGVGFALVLTGLLARERAVGPPRWGALGSAARFLGDRSYSLYLVHFTVLNVAVEGAARLMHAQDKNALGATPVMGAAVLLGVLATFGVTEVTYGLVEAPSHRLARRLSRRAGAKAAPGAAAVQP
jgi:peptidoglycan/LPS O-acetylase OafA/YrhL